MAEAVDWCSWWPDTIAGAYIGACCMGHDLTSRGWLDFASHLRLGGCVAKTAAGPLWGGVMAGGIMLFGWAYAISKRATRRRD